MAVNFDKVIDRRGTNSLKYDFASERGMPEDILPLWVADMDFQVPMEVSQVLKDTAAHGIFGYSDVKEKYVETLSDWYKEYFDWKVEREWLIKTPGVVFAIAMAIRAFTREGDGVMIQQPVYYPFANTIQENDRTLVINDLICEEGIYSVDFQDFERKIKEHQVKIFLLCSPHNPVGRVWSKEELQKMGDICLKYGVFVISDEIHSDFTYEGYHHEVFARLGDRYAQNCMICTAPSKTFNLAGLQISNIWIPNPERHKKMKKEISKTGYCECNIMGLLACQAAYEHGRSWLLELKEYLAGNLAFVRTYLKEQIPQIRLIEPQGTYLIWLDLRGLGLTQEEQDQLIVEKAGLWLDTGAMFGKSGKGFERINIACPRSVIERALVQLRNALR